MTQNSATAVAETPRCPAAPPSTRVDIRPRHPRTYSTCLAAPGNSVGVAVPRFGATARHPGRWVAEVVLAPGCGADRKVLR
ncbi:hypothetical protein NWFMUON74_24010 [Nocardia wallacei]|uniref:Uncharacterized protein n=1 Tax=Nocardia wallacei TaxID=480035 RepID=A0A7G1KKX2_9NOCA|nr:hypothetical protein NWFMUON74_24010 [Nocardia wallacei]